MKELISKRIEKQPIDKYSAGSTFKRGKDFYASQIINECNLKGYSVNDAKVSEKHSGFLINENNELIFNEIEDSVGARALYELTDINIASLYIEHIYKTLLYL